MPKKIDSLLLFEKALQHGISIAPGTIFTITDKYRNCIRVNTALWSDRIEQAIETLGGLAETILN
jgi:DNA-binding transcriptional MocR family regulator